MFSKLKYILFDFSDNFKSDFLATLKKSFIFLVIGLIALLLQNALEPASIVAGGCILVFGFIWGRDLIASLAILGSISNNIMIKWTILIFLYLIGIGVGYIYFLWCLIKMIVVVIKKASKN